MKHESLPTELGLEFFCALDSLEDVLSLSATSRWLRGIWIKHADLIYREVSPRSIKGERHARALQFAISGNIEITASDALSIMHRAKFVESIVTQFDEKVMKRIPGFAFRDFYKDGRHPKELTTTECPRFIRTYYRLWNLIRRDEQQWQSYIDSLSMKQVYLLREMCWVPLPIGDDLPGPKMQDHFPRYYFYSKEGRRGKLSSVLHKTIIEYAKRKDSYWCEEDPWIVREETLHEGYAGFFMLWDHAKPALKQFCLGRPSQQKVSLSKEELEYEQRHLWAESSDEEDGI